MKLPTLTLLGALATISGAALAQTVTPTVAPTPSTDISVVTVFGHLPKKPSATVRRLDSSRASSCAFFGNHSSFTDELMDSYMDHFHGAGRENDEGDQATTDLEGNYVAANQSFRDTSPNGDASRESTTRYAEPVSAANGGCGPTDRNSAAARNYIARKDKTLTEAFAAYDAGDFNKALATFKLSYSRIGYDEAARMLGDMYLLGQGTPRDVAQALAWYIKVADARLTKDQLSPYNPKDPEHASSRVEAQLQLAKLYMAGTDVPKDEKAARKWFKEASELNHVPARYVLGRMNQTGYGGPKDIKEAIRLYTNAAEYGYAQAQWELASLYLEGRDTPQDLKAAFAWAQQAAANPAPFSKKPHAQLALAHMYDEGKGTAPDANRALALFKMSAVAGHPEAQNALATYFYTGQIVKQDTKIARKLFFASASQGNDEAMMNLAVLLFKGEGGEADMTQSYVWLELARKLGNPKAAPMLAVVDKRLTPEQRSKALAVLAPVKKQ